MSNTFRDFVRKENAILRSLSFQMGNRELCNQVSAFINMGLSRHHQQKVNCCDERKRNALISIKRSTSSGNENDEENHKKKSNSQDFLFLLNRRFIIHFTLSWRWLWTLESENTNENINKFKLFSFAFVASFSFSARSHSLSSSCCRCSELFVCSSSLHAFRFTEIEVIWIIAISLNNHVLYLFYSTLRSLRPDTKRELYEHSVVNWTDFQWVSSVVSHMCVVIVYSCIGSTCNIILLLFVA